MSLPLIDMFVETKDEEAKDNNEDAEPNTKEPLETDCDDCSLMKTTFKNCIFFPWRFYFEL